MKLFKGNSTNIRSQYAERTGTELASAANASTAVRLIVLNQSSHAFNLDNGLNVEIQLLVVNPEDTTKTKVPWLALGASKNLNLELFHLNMQLEAGLEIWAYYPGGVAPTTTLKLRMFTWG